MVLWPYHVVLEGWVGGLVGRARQPVASLARADGRKGLGDATRQVHSRDLYSYINLGPRPPPEVPFVSPEQQPQARTLPDPSSSHHARLPVLGRLRDVVLPARRRPRQPDRPSLRAGAPARAPNPWPLSRLTACSSSPAADRSTGTSSSASSTRPPSPRRLPTTRPGGIRPSASRLSSMRPQPRRSSPSRSSSTPGPRAPSSSTARRSVRPSSSLRVSCIARLCVETKSALVSGCLGCWDARRRRLTRAPREIGSARLR